MCMFVWLVACLVVSLFSFSHSLSLSLLFLSACHPVRVCLFLSPSQLPPSRARSLSGEINTWMYYLIEGTDDWEFVPKVVDT